jgi:hypothetical protein
MTKNKIDLYNAEHPSRKLAILVLEQIQKEFKQTIRNGDWYTNEDYLTDTIEAIKTGLHEHLK